MPKESGLADAIGAERKLLMNTAVVRVCPEMALVLIFVARLGRRAFEDNESWSPPTPIDDVIEVSAARFMEFFVVRRRAPPQLGLVDTRNRKSR